TEPIRGHILIAEDNTINQLVIKRQLQQFGYVADVASDGAEALEAYRQGDYKLLLTDCHMPEMDGFELTEAIRAEERGSGARLPIVAITANALQGEADRCLTAGMDDFLTKPVELKKVGAVLNRWLQDYAPEPVPKNPMPRPAPDAPTTPANTDSAESAAEAEKSNEASRPIDLAMLSRLLGTDDDNYLKEMIAVYWDTMRDTPGELAQLVAARKASDLRDAAHAAKGASASVGAVPASSLLEKLQFAATDADWARINDLMPQIESAFTDLEQFVGRMEAA
ncbi:MAG: response regulator, partial [Gammaproteobacteria bacterium]